LQLLLLSHTLSSLLCENNNNPHKNKHENHSTQDTMTAPAGAASLAGKRIQFVTNTSAIELPFYAKLFALKLDHDKLNDSTRPVLGVYQPLNVEPEYSSKIQILGNALSSDKYTSLSVSLSVSLSQSPSPNLHST